MKKLLLVAACIVASVAAMAQGSLVVANSTAVNGVAAPIFDTDGVTKLTGANFWVQVYAGGSADSLTAQGTAVNFRTGNNIGLFSAQTLSVASVAPGGSAFVQVKAWEGAAGSTYESALSGGKKAGFGNIVGPFVTGGAGTPPSTPPNVTGLTSFSLVIPEPSTIALALLGAGALFIRRRS